MAKLDLTDLTQLSSNETSAVAAINANSAATETAMENTLSRDGTTPNNMEADFDLDSNKVINVADPTNNQDAVTKIYGDTNYGGSAATAAAVSAAAALVSENATAADLVLTNADVVSTAADAVSTAADVVSTAADLAALNAAAPDNPLVRPIGSPPVTQGHFLPYLDQNVQWTGDFYSYVSSSGELGAGNATVAGAPSTGDAAALTFTFPATVKEFTADAGTDICTSPTHTFSDTDQVTVISDITLPGGLSSSTDYYIITATTDTFQLSLTSGGAAVNITSVGSGTHTVKSDTLQAPNTVEISYTVTTGQTLEQVRDAFVLVGAANTDLFGASGAGVWVQNNQSVLFPENLTWTGMADQRPFVTDTSTGGMSFTGIVNTNTILDIGMQQVHKRFISGRSGKPADHLQGTIWVGQDETGAARSGVTRIARNKVVTDGSYLGEMYYYTFDYGGTGGNVLEFAYGDGFHIGTDLNGQQGRGTLNVQTAYYLNKVLLENAAQTLTNKKLVGVTDGSAATAGNVGEYISSEVASGSAVSLTSAVPANVTSITLSAGDWDIWATVNYTGNASTNVGFFINSISNTSATLDQSVGRAGARIMKDTPFGTSTSWFEPIVGERISVSGSTAIYLVAFGSFSVSTLSAFGGLYARRVR